MKKAILAQKVLASVLTIGLGGFVLPLAAQANSGLSEDTVVQIGGFEYCVGSKGAADNVVIIDKGLDKGVIGGYAETDNAVNNRITISSGEFEELFYGGYAASGNATDNIVNISGGEIAGVINGGYALDANKQVKNNHVNITGGVIRSLKHEAVPGILVPAGGLYGGEAAGENSIVAGNSVNISWEAVIEDFYEMASIGGGIARGKNSQVTGNSVTVSDGTIRGSWIDGGDARGVNSQVTGNSVTVSGGMCINSSIVGGYAFVDTDPIGSGAEKVNSTVEGNSVTVSGGMCINSSIYGGYAVVDTDSSGGEAQGVKSQVTGNSVTVSGGMVKGEVYGGYVWNGGSDSTVTGNSVTLLDGAELNEADLYGGIILDWLKNDIGNETTVKDNKLIINGWSGTVQSINNFNGDDGGIEVKALAGGLDLAAGKATNFITVTGREVKGEDEEDVNHIYIENSEIQKNSKQVKDIQAGVALTVSGTIAISNDNKNIYINPTSVRASDQTAITTESRAAAAAFVNQGAETVSDSINSLQRAEAGISTFATVSGNNSKYDTGSYVDINGWNGIVGVAKTKDLNAGKFSYGAFFENGGGNYNTYNDFNGTSFRGDGNVVYNGGGLLMRYEQEDGIYTEASLRAGTAKNEVSNALEFTGNRYGFKTENAYYGAHIGIGKIIKLDNGKAWDIYGKYFHTHHEGDSVKIANDVFDFDSVDSDKLRIGARFSERQGEKLTSYYGLAWEYEFSGDAGGTANHYAMYTPSLEGSTVIGEVGFRYTPGKASPWYFDANVRGYAGMQEGISGSVQAVYSF